MSDSLINFGIYATYILIALCLVAILIFSVGRVIAHPGAAKSALIGIVGLGVLTLISMGLSTGADANTIFAKLNVSEGSSKMVGTGLHLFYFLIALAVLSIIYVEITRLFKKNG